MQKSSQINFYKYQATGNDFIVIDNRNVLFDFSDKELWANICSRRTGIGADGVLLVEKGNSKDKTDFSMIYINSDGGVASMCGNGARAISHFVEHQLKFNLEEYRFKTKDSIYWSKVDEDKVTILMNEIKDTDNCDFCNESIFKGYKRVYSRYTGVPHLVLEVSNDLDGVEVFRKGKKLRYHHFFPQGTNVNFLEITNHKKQLAKIRTYERGVESETLSCGTGAVAGALFLHDIYNFRGSVIMQTKGGDLIVNFDNDQIYLTGKVKKVYEGLYYITSS